MRLWSSQSARLGEPGARDDLALRRGLAERGGERRDPVRRDRDQHIDMLGREPADAGVLGLVLGAEFDHAGGHEDAAPVGLAQHVEQIQRRGKPDRVRVVGVVDHDRAVRPAA